MLRQCCQVYGQAASCFPSLSAWILACLLLLACLLSLTVETKNVTDLNSSAWQYVLTTEDGQQIRVSKGSKAMYKYLDAGEVMLLDGNVACEGGELKIGGEEALEYCGVRHHRVLSPHCQSD